MQAFVRKLSTLVGVNHALMLAYRAEIYLWVLAHVLPFLMMGLWATAAANSPGQFSMSALDYQRYFLAVFAVRQFSAVWMIYMFEWEMIEGRLSNYMLKPFHPLWYYVASHLGEQLARVPFFLLTVGVFLAFNRDLALSGWGIRFILAGVLVTYAAFALRFAMQWCFAMLSFWFERASNIESLSFMPYVFLSGLAIPISDFPPALQAVLAWTPFPYMISLPARVITGSAMSHEVLFGLAVTTGWFVFFFVVGAILWRRGLYKYAGQGA